MRQDHFQEAAILSKVQDKIYKKSYFHEMVLESGYGLSCEVRRLLKKQF